MKLKAISLLKKGDQSQRAPLVFGGFLAALAVTMISLVALLLSFNALPSSVPLLFTTGSALTGKAFLFAVPALSLFFVLGNAFVSLAFIKKGEKAASLFPAFLALFVSLILAVSLIRIIWIFPIPPLPFENEIYPLLLPLGTSAILSLILSTVIAKLAQRFKIFDKPHGPYPQVRPIPRFGALPIFLTFSTVTLLFAPVEKHLIALLAGAAIITIIQTIDDIRPLPPAVQGAGHILAALAIVAGGVGIDFIRNPLAGWIGETYIRLDTWEIPISLFGVIYHFTVLADLFTLVWIFTLVNVVDWIDGLDGLAAGIGAVAGVAIVAVSIIFNTPITALLGIILAGALLGFLPSNFYPAKIYLGGGAFLLGYLLAVLSIFSGAKTGTAMLVLAIPIIDAFHVIYRRLRKGRSPFAGDKTHLHHRLMEAGLKHPQIVLLEWGIVAAIAVPAVVLKGFSKFAAVALVFVGALLVNKVLLTRLGSKAQKRAEL